MENTNNLDELFKALMDEETVFPARLLFKFSNLSRADLQTIERQWLSIPLQRRRNLVSDLAEMAERDPMLLFEDIGRVALQDYDDAVVESAIDLLFEEEDPRLASTYLSILTDANRGEQVRAAAANILGVRLASLGESRQGLADRIDSALLHAHREDPSDLVRRRALEALGFSSHADVPKLIRAAFARSELDWVESALFAMGRSADEQWEEAVLSTLTHEHLPVRVQAFHAAGELCLQRARSTLLKALKKEGDQEIRHEAIWALSQIGGEGVHEKLEALLEETDDDEEAQLIEEALDAINFANGDGGFDMLAYSGERARERKDDLSDDFLETPEEENEGSLLSPRTDRELREWERYVSGEDDLDDEEEYDEDEDDPEDLDDEY